MGVFIVFTGRNCICVTSAQVGQTLLVFGLKYHLPAWQGTVPVTLTLQTFYIDCVKALMSDADKWREIMGDDSGGSEGVFAYLQADSRGPLDEDTYYRKNFHGSFAGSPRPRKQPR